jgi:TolB-like protein
MNSLMRTPITTTILFFAALLIAGCSTSEETVRLCADDEGDFHPCADIEMSEAKSQIEIDPTSPDFQSTRSFQTLNEYTEQMVHQLSKKLSGHEINKLIMVPPFVALSPFESSNDYLSVDIAEAFIVDMQCAGFPTAELIVANISDDYEADYLTYLDESIDNSDVGYVVKGSMRKTVNGIMIYAKVIDLKSKKVIASTNKLLPLYLIQ